MVKADNTPSDFIYLHIICYLGHFVGGGGETKPCLIFIRNIIYLLKLHEISYVNI